MPAVALRSGGVPYKGVRNTRNPYTPDPAYLQDFLNGYILDTILGGDFLARPGFSLQNENDPLDGPGQGVYTHTSLDGASYNFTISGSILYRVDSGLVTYTDVTPVGITIDPDVRRVYFVSFGDYLIISDGVNRPWLASDLSGTPITGTYIDFDGAGVSWSAFGKPTIYAGCVIFVLNQVNSVGAQTDIAWSSPGDPSEGYQQSNFDYRWTLEQTGSAPIFGILGTNSVFYYWRSLGIGYLTGTPGPDFQTTATHDAVADNVGLQQSATIARYLNNIFFCDQIGRPCMLPIGGKVINIWEQMTKVVNNATSAYPTNTATVSIGVIEPNLNLYLAAIWSPTPGTADAPIEFQVFDAKTGTYLGRWRITTEANVGCSIEAVGVLNNVVGGGRLVVIGSSNAPPTDSGFVWVLSAVEGGEGLSLLTTEGGEILTTEDGTALTTEDVVVTWKDNDEVPAIQATTLKLGEDSDIVYNIDQGTLMTGNDSPVEVTISTPNTSGTVQGTPTPTESEDETFRLVFGAEAQGRGPQVTVSPTEADSQWAFMGVKLRAIPSRADPLDP